MNSEKDVLVVEDDETINFMIGEYLKLEGRDYRAALDGGTALQKVQEKTPGLIILDLMLPDMDGFEVCRRMKTSGALEKVPVVILSALADEQSRKEGLACGAVEYLTKPFDPDTLLQAVTRHSR